MVSFPSDLSSYVDSSDETLTNEDINTVIFEMLNQIFIFQNSLLSPTIEDDDDNNNNKTLEEAGGNGDESSSSSINCFSGKNNKKKKNENNKQTIGSNNGSSNNVYNQHLHLHGQLEKLRGVVNYVEESFKELTVFEQLFKTTVKSALRSVSLTVKEVTETPQDNSSLQINNVVQAKLNKLNDIVMNLRLLVRSVHSISHLSLNLRDHTTLEDPSSSNSVTLINQFRALPFNTFFRNTSASNDIRQVYCSLDIKLKLCLLCFSVFPEGAVVKRTILLYWWIGEGLIDIDAHSSSFGGKTVEGVADDFLKELLMEGFIHPAGNNHRRPVADSFTMPYLIRSVVIQIAKEMDYVDFDLKGNPTSKFSSCYTACLTKGSSFSTSKNSVEDNEKLRTLFNVSEVSLKIEADWFIGLNHLCVLQLGRWNISATRGIKVKKTDFLKRLENMKHLVYFSLQGISGIKELPDTIGSLTSLRILDLRACHDLEVLPEEIALLKNLTHLDLSNCYFLNSVPKGIASLSELQVLKGFVISDPEDFLNGRSPCTLDDLKNLPNLRKLSIITGRVTAFPTYTDLKSLQQLKALSKLKIAWGEDSSNQSSAAAAAYTIVPTSMSTLALPTALEKLELQSFPHSKRPNWLNPSQLTSLKKLYIRGGTLSDLSHTTNQWTVEILSLKYLGYLKMNWTKLQASFPNLKSFEKVQCPKLTLCPCDDRGMWRKQIN